MICKEIAKLRLGEDHIGDLLCARGPERDASAGVGYMRALVRHMRESRRAPMTERLEVNSQDVVISGNHRTLAAWLLGWSHLDFQLNDQIAGWSVPLEEGKRAALEEVLGLEPLRPAARSGGGPPPTPEVGGCPKLALVPACGGSSDCARPWPWPACLEGAAVAPEVRVPAAAEGAVVASGFEIGIACRHPALEVMLGLPRPLADKHMRTSPCARRPQVLSL